MEINLNLSDLQITSLTEYPSDTICGINITIWNEQHSKKVSHPITELSELTKLNQYLTIIINQYGK